MNDIPLKVVIKHYKKGVAILDIHHPEKYSDGVSITTTNAIVRYEIKLPMGHPHTKTNSEYDLSNLIHNILMELVNNEYLVKETSITYEKSNKEERETTKREGSYLRKN